nr:ABC transporter ATP-binding protein [Kineosphaera limosa]
MLACRDLQLTLGGTPILRGVDAVFEGGAIAVVGRSGAGKTSLLHCLAGLRTPTAGEVTFDGASLAAMSEEDRARLRLERFGFVFQRAELLGELSLLENIALPLEMRGEPRRECARRAAELVERLDLSDCAGRRPDRVSGGQRQRAAVARAVVGRPAVVFADEPTGALDERNGRFVVDMLLQQCAHESAALVMVTHDAQWADLCDRRLTMADGVVAADDVSSASERASTGPQ